MQRSSGACRVQEVQVQIWRCRCRCRYGGAEVEQRSRGAEIQKCGYGGVEQVQRCRCGGLRC